jgi:5-methylcytosine-specific restriction endonuclease McrBC regulatory subunit McrC
VNHPYFIKYRPLQKLCLQILNRENTNVGKEDELHGVLFDGAWLWEEYLNKLFMEGRLSFTHAENKTKKNPIYLFNENKEYDRYPDFYNNNFILDAKYKPRENIGRDDFHQIITYMHVKSAKLGGFIYPSNQLDNPKNNPENIGTLNGYGGEVRIWSLTIPQDYSSFKVFKEIIKGNEQELINSYLEMLKQLKSC